MSDCRPYTYVTASVEEGVTRLGVSFHTADLSVMAMTVGGARPALSFGSSEGQMTISTTGGGPVTAADVALAREIFQAAGRYLAECERLCPDASDPGDLGATDGLGAVTA